MDSQDIDQNDKREVFNATRQYKKLYNFKTLLDLTSFDDKNEKLDNQIREEVKKIVQYADSLLFEDRPDYEAIIKILLQCQKLTMS